jgi:hypothetical protein
MLNEAQTIDGIGCAECDLSIANNSIINGWAFGL